MRSIARFAFFSVICLVLLIGMSGCAGTQSTDMNAVSTRIIPTNEWKIDHAVIVVENLSASMEKFTEAGFNVVPGGEHADNITHNALIPFEDGSYLEIFTPVDPALAAEMRELVASGTFDSALKESDAMQKRFMRHLAEGTGLRDFAVSYPCLNLSEEQVIADQGGFVLEGPIEMSRTRPDGIVVRWHVAVPVSGSSTCFPFLIADDTPRSLRVPDGNLTSHPNGVTGIERIEIAARDPDDVDRWYETVLQTSPDCPSGSSTSCVLDGSSIAIRSILGNETEGPVRIVLHKSSGETFGLEDIIRECL
jgi:hypothetical protein